MRVVVDIWDASLHGRSLRASPLSPKPLQVLTDSSLGQFLLSSVPLARVMQVPSGKRVFSPPEESGSKVDLGWLLSKQPRELRRDLCYGPTPWQPLLPCCFFQRELCARVFLRTVVALVHVDGV